MVSAAICRMIMNRADLYLSIFVR